MERHGLYKGASGRLIRTLTNHAQFRERLDGHVAAMAPLGLNAHALGRVATRHLPALLGTPEALAKHFLMLCDFFAPWGNELVDDLRRTTVPAVCLPAVLQNAALDVSVPAAPSADTCISRLHKAALAGPTSFWAWTEDGLEEHMRTLVEAGLFTTEARARCGCMSKNNLLSSYKLEWYVWRKAAVLEAGGSMADVHLACGANGNLQSAFPCLLLFKRSRCAPRLQPRCAPVSVSRTPASRAIPLVVNAAANCTAHALLHVDVSSTQQMKPRNASLCS